MGKLDNTPNPVRESIAIALMIAAVTGTAAAYFHEPLFIFGGFVLFLIFYVWKIDPRIKAAYREEEQKAYDAKYADDATYEPILQRFQQTHNDLALIDEYETWKQGPYDNQVRLRFLQTAILELISAGKIYHVEILMEDAEKIAAEEGVTDRFLAFRAECDQRIAEVAKQRLS